MRCEVEKGAGGGKEQVKGTVRWREGAGGGKTYVEGRHMWRERAGRGRWEPSLLKQAKGVHVFLKDLGIVKRISQGIM